MRKFDNDYWIKVRDFANTIPDILSETKKLKNGEVYNVELEFEHKKVELIYAMQEELHLEVRPIYSVDEILAIHSIAKNKFDFSSLEDGKRKLVAIEFNNEFFVVTIINRQGEIFVQDIKLTHF